MTPRDNGRLCRMKTDIKSTRQGDRPHWPENRNRKYQASNFTSSKQLMKCLALNGVYSMFFSLFITEIMML